MEIRSGIPASIATCWFTTWEVLPPMPTSRAGCAATTADGLIYVCGGGGFIRAPQGFSILTVGHANQPQLIFAVAGRLGETVLNVFERFDPAIQRWEVLPRHAAPSIQNAMTRGPRMGGWMLITQWMVRVVILNLDSNASYECYEGVVNDTKHLETIIGFVKPWSKTACIDLL